MTETPTCPRRGLIDRAHRHTPSIVTPRTSITHLQKCTTSQKKQIIFKTLLTPPLRNQMFIITFSAAAIREPMSSKTPSPAMRLRCIYLIRLAFFRTTTATTRLGIRKLAMLAPSTPIALIRGTSSCFRKCGKWICDKTFRMPLNGGNIGSFKIKNSPPYFHQFPLIQKAILLIAFTLFRSFFSLLFFFFFILSFNSREALGRMPGLKFASRNIL